MPDRNTEEQKYRSFLEGDMESFEWLVIEYKDSLIYFISRYVKDVAAAEDLAQDAFVEVLVHKERYNFRTSFKTWLFTIGRNKAVDYIRKYNRVSLVEEYPEEASEEELLEDRVIRKEEKRELYQALKSLKEEYQQALYLIDLEEMSYSQAAEIMGKSQAQIKILIFRARKALKKVLGREGLADEE
ncbi:MAG TPA: RNA polymerase sigma factor [Candidatus Caccomorpha excrementavium]|nr:RNA polymerase sigma factor [Candidatus Caccomorpha excrementavium]